MDEYPTPDELQELFYLEELDILKEMEEEEIKDEYILNAKCLKNSLNFDSPSEGKKISFDVKLQNNDSSQNEAKVTDDGRKRRLSSESLFDETSDLDIVERPGKKYKSSVETVTPSHECGSISTTIPNCPFISITTDSGKKLYVKVNQDSTSGNLNRYPTRSNKNSGLLMTPYCRLKGMALETLKRLNRPVLNVKKNIIDKSDIWIEKYKPKTYFDLLSDESVNRTLLKWLRMWDKVVFKKEVKSSTVITFEDKFKTKMAFDKYGRPQYKIALLSGPPGLGKTTLAHFVAKLVGYNVIEVNASDDRTVDALRTKLEATKMNSVIGNHKPSCLILDEIDGAPGPTIEFLLNYINGKDAEKSKKRKKKKITGMNRPVICICNDLYCPNLRQLRQQAFILRFPNTSSTNLVERLSEICIRQNIRADYSALALLCERAENDIRSCISTLYFFKNKRGQRLRSADVIQSPVGKKDIQKGVFTIWKEIFQNKIPEECFFSILLDKGKQESVLSRMRYNKKAMDKLHSIVDMFHSFSDYDKLVLGVFENFPKSRSYWNADSVVNSLEWFSWFDFLHSTIKKGQNFMLMPYLPYGFAAWHFLFASNIFFKINYPVIGFENYKKEMRSKQILNDVRQGLSVPMRPYNTSNALLLDILPLLRLILMPSIPYLNTVLFTPDEKKDLKEVVNIMIEYNLNYLQQRSEDGAYSFHYDPNIDELCHFNIAGSSSSRTLEYGVKQIISHEVVVERIRRAAAVSPEFVTEQTADNKEDEVDSESHTAKTTKEPKGKTSKEKEVQYTDFFGRVVRRKYTSFIDNMRYYKLVQVKSPVCYVYKEGFNGFVKRNITLASIL